jgi:hypothetical protein
MGVSWDASSCFGDFGNLKKTSKLRESRFSAFSTSRLKALRRCWCCATNNWDFARAAVSRRMRAVPVFTPPALSVSGKDVFNGATHQRLCATNPLGLIATEFFVDYLSAALYQYI